MAEVLLIEPDIGLAKSYAIALGRAGHRATICTSAQSAINACDKKLPDVVLMELQIADHNGIEFLYEFRSYPEWQLIPVIVLSIVSPQEFGDKSVLREELGVSSYLYKPTASLKQVVGSVEDLVASSA